MLAAYPSCLATSLCIWTSAGNHTGASANVKHNPPSQRDGVPRAHLPILPPLLVLSSCSPCQAKLWFVMAKSINTECAAALTRALPALFLLGSWGSNGRALERAGDRPLPAKSAQPPAAELPEEPELVQKSQTLGSFPPGRSFHYEELSVKHL